MDIATLSARYDSGALTPTAHVEALCASARSEGLFIERVGRDELLAAARAVELRRRDGAALPLYGVPFAVKDNIDVAGRRTTAACPDFGYVATETATVVARLVAAGALLVGKTNLDQLATGLVGVRSPYGIPRNPFDDRYIVGGSSAGSAAAVARGFVSFALGTDTAGSGRVPAAFTNIVGFKPTRGLLSVRGVVPNCRTLDCVSLFALTADDAVRVAAVATAHDRGDPASRPDADGFRWDGTAPTGFRFGVPDDADLDLDDAARALHRAAIARLEAMGGRAIPIAFAPLREASSLFYEGPWAADRLVTNGGLLNRDPEAILPAVREVLLAARAHDGAAVFAAIARREALRAAVRTLFDDLCVILLPATPTVFTIAEAQKDPGISARLARYTAFANVLDLPAIVVPAGERSDGLPAGAMLVGYTAEDARLCAIAAAMHRALGGTLGATSAPLPPAPPQAARAAEDVIRIAVAGHHLSGEPQNEVLVALGARLVRTCRTVPRYRLFLLAKTHPPRPVLVRAWDRGGQSIDVELWELPRAALGRFYATLESPLALATVETDEGECVPGVVCEAHGASGAREISGFGGWKRFQATQR